MTNDELKEALTTRCPVVARIPHTGEEEYAYVSAIIYRATERGKIFIQAELMDKNGNSVTTVNAKQVSFCEKAPDEEEGEEAGNQEKTA